MARKKGGEDPEVKRCVGKSESKFWGHADGFEQFEFEDALPPPSQFRHLFAIKCEITGNKKVREKVSKKVRD